MKIRRILSFTLIAALFLTGCGGKTSTAENGEASQSGEHYYRVEEVSFPEAPNPEIPEGGHVGRVLIAFEGDYISRFVGAYNADWSPIEDIGYVECYPVSKGEWEAYSLISEAFMLDGREYTGASFPLFSSIDGEIYCHLYRADGEGFDLGTRDRTEVREYICPFPEKIWEECAPPECDKVLVRDLDGCFYLFGREQSVLYSFDEKGENVCKRELPGKIYGVLQADQGEKLYWYGIGEDGKAVVKSVDGEETLLESFDGIAADFYAAFAGDGSLYLADTQKIWRMEEEPVTAVSLPDNDYIIKELYGMEKGEDGELTILARFDYKTGLLKMRELDKPLIKEELVIAFSYPHLAMTESITRFNRQSTQYHISILLPEEKEEEEAFRKRIQLEMSTGKGPDILGSNMILDITPYVENGYLECLDGVITDESAYLQAAFDSSRMDGHLYGIPYDCQFDFVSYKKADAGERISWTLQELVEAVRASDAEVLEEDCTGYSLIMRYALKDNSNTAYIDWEKGESHLSEQPFLDLLAFAKEYADTDDKKKEGFSYRSMFGFSRLDDMKFIYSQVGEDTAVLGYPREQGNGIYVTSNELYLNACSGCKEGAKEFFRYLLSEEEQIKYVTYDSWKQMHEYNLQSISGNIGSFPVYLAAYEPLVAYELARDADPGSYDSRGKYTEEMIESFYFILEHAELDNYNITPLEDVVWEELAPYFEGQISAEEAAEKLHNRVQLYLDERKR